MRYYVNILAMENSMSCDYPESCFHLLLFFNKQLEKLKICIFSFKEVCYVAKSYFFYCCPRKSNPQMLQAKSSAFQPELIRIHCYQWLCKPEVIYSSYISSKFWPYMALDMSDSNQGVKLHSLGRCLIAQVRVIPNRSWRKWLHLKKTTWCCFICFAWCNLQV